MCKIIFYRDTRTVSRRSTRKTMPGKATGKFVQLRAASAEYFVFAPLEVCRYHADILERFCNKRGIPGIYHDTEKRYEILDDAWSVIGGGKYILDTAQRHIRLFGNSMAYGNFDRSGMKKKILSSRKFSGYDVLIE